MDNPSQSKKSYSTGIRQHPRFSARPLHRLSLHVPETDQQIKIANISLGGVGLFASPVVSALKKDFTGLLTVGKSELGAQIKKVFEGKDIIGCSFIDPSADLQRAIDSYFQTELQASKVNRVVTIPDRNNNQDKTIFFHGQNNCELLINTRNSQICYFSVVVLGNSVEVEPRKSIQVGELFEEKKIPTRPGVFLFKPLASSQHVIDNAVRFIDSIEGLDVEYKQNLIMLLGETPLQSAAGKTKASER